MQPGLHTPPRHPSVRLPPEDDDDDNNNNSIPLFPALSSLPFRGQELMTNEKKNCNMCVSG